MASRSPPDLLETPISPKATSISPILPSPTPGKSMPPSPSPSPPNLGRKTSLIDLKDWVVDDGPLPYVPRQRPPIVRKPPPLAPKPTPRHVSDSFMSKPSPPLISLDSPPKTRAALHYRLENLRTHLLSPSRLQTPPTQAPAVHARLSRHYHNHQELIPLPLIIHTHHCLNWASPYPPVMPPAPQYPRSTQYRFPRTVEIRLPRAPEIR